MAFFDIHCHLDQLSDPDEAIREAEKNSVTRIVAVSEGVDSGKKALQLKQMYPGCVFAGLGIHPMYSVTLSEVKVKEGLDFIEQNLGEADLLGEVGLDYKYAVTEKEQSFQRELLKKQLDLAAAYKKPVNLHSRRSQRQVMEAAIEYRKKTGRPALLHWFTQSKKLIRICAEEGIYVSAGPSVLFDGPALDVSLTVPDHLLLVETDSPVPFGGEPAQPSWIPRIVKTLAKSRNMETAALAQILNENFERYNELL